MPRKIGRPEASDCFLNLVRGIPKGDPLRDDLAGIIDYVTRLESAVDRLDAWNLVR